MVNLKQNKLANNLNQKMQNMFKAVSKRLPADILLREESDYIDITQSANPNFFETLRGEMRDREKVITLLSSFRSNKRQRVR